MAYKFEEGKDAIIQAVVDNIKDRMNNEQTHACIEFVRQFFGTVAIEDLNEWHTEDLYGAAMHFWNLIYQRQPDETKVHIYNPDYEQQGWQTTHTVIEVICKDMPFLVDTIRMVVKRLNLGVHLIIHMGGLRVMRDAEHNITAVLPRFGELLPGTIIEAPIFVEIDRQTDPMILADLQTKLIRGLLDVKVVTEDWLLMREKVREASRALEHAPSSLDMSEIEESRAFLNWVEDHHFTFLGIRDYELVKKKTATLLRAIPNTGLGVLRDGYSRATIHNLTSQTPEAQELSFSPHILVMSKTNTLAAVHRDAYADYIGIKHFNEQGEVIGERRIIGLYTSAAYNTNPKHIPFLRHKVASLLQQSKLNPKSHAGRVLLNILDTLPRDDLIQGTEEELLEIAMGIFHMQERHRIRMFARMDIYHRFVSCLVYVPKDRFNTELRENMQEILATAFHAHDITFSTFFSESVLARIHFLVRLSPDHKQTYFDFHEIEKKLIEVGRSWRDDLQHFLLDTFGEEEANRLNMRYRQAFTAGYISNFSPRTAVLDIKHIEQLSPSEPLGMNFYKPLDEVANNFRLKLFQQTNTLPISDIVPIIENLGLRAISERPFSLKLNDGTVIWINEFSMHYPHSELLDSDRVKNLFQETFLNVWLGNIDNDGFNKLVVRASLDFRQVDILRAYAKYFKQIGFTFSQDYIETTLNNNPQIAAKLVNLFQTRFNPADDDKREENYQALIAAIHQDLNEVVNLDEDKIIRQYLLTISATLRTNYYQFKPYVAIKLDSRAIPNLPRPLPLYEIYIYAPQFEGVHLRGGYVARGGIRWSDRREDFRTEILGLMKAQQVKNAVIVPSGAKGGFITRPLPVNATREEITAEGVRCYQQFISGLLDLTDNYQAGNIIIKPENVICYDENDPYLVVAADKGTATFSDYANEISLKYNFWLGDAFASGGSFGYDHKKIGITARGAWESVQRHFHALNIDPSAQDFTVVGIGDMSGDVFGNGMLLSEHIHLVGAFNHAHIFIDPNPKALASFKERTRLFHLPRSTWEDYDPKLISKGGGVFSRKAKSIVVSKEMQQRFLIEQKEIEPNELIRILLRTQVDLLWSAGIGTFVKSKMESHAEVGDRTNDAIRINAAQLQAKSVVEGGNLGFTQLGRIEYALNGGLIYTDFIDNSAGVSCSDKEVNIKILLNLVVTSGDLTFKQRNELLSSMTDEVALLVLRENYMQTRAINLMAAQTIRSWGLHTRYLNELDRIGKLDRDIEYLPDDKNLAERRTVDKGLTAPEIAILLCYSKIILKEAILASNVPEDAYIKQLLATTFPEPLQARFAKQMQQHPLRREIIATKISNLIVNEMGFTFVYRLQDETGAQVAAIVRAYMIARQVLEMEKIWDEIDNISTKITSDKQTSMMMVYLRLLRRTTRWFLRMQRTKMDIAKSIKRFAPGVAAIKKAIPEILSPNNLLQYNEAMQQYQAMGASVALSRELTMTRGLFTVLDIVDIAEELHFKAPEVAKIYFALGEFLELDWLRTQVIVHATENHWEALSREALRDDLDWQQRKLAHAILDSQAGKDPENAMVYVQEWADQHKSLVSRWKKVLTNLRGVDTLTYTMFFVAIRELLDLTQTTLQLRAMEFVK